MSFNRIALAFLVVEVAAFGALTRSVLLTLALSLALPLGILVIASVVSSLCALAVAPVAKAPLGYNLRSLTVRWKTTLMTALAFTLVVFLLTVMLAYVNGMNEVVQSSGHAGNVLVLSDGASDEVMSNLPAGASVERLPQDVQKKVLRTADGKAYLGTKEVYVIVSQPLMTPSAIGATSRLAQMRGIDDPQIASQVHGVSLVKGRWFASTGEPEVVLGEGIARDIADDRGQKSVEPGEEVELGPYKWKIVGIMKTAGT